MLGDINSRKSGINDGAVTRNHLEMPNIRVAAPFIKKGEQ